LAFFYKRKDSFAVRGLSQTVLCDPCQTGKVAELWTKCRCYTIGMEMEPRPAEDRQPQRGRELLFRIATLLNPVFWIVAIPFFLIERLSHPYAALLAARRRREERRFAGDMARANRRMDWRAFEQSLNEKRGTLIVEALSPKGPTRWWWTSDDMASGTPYRFPKTLMEAVTDFDGLFDEACRWCHEEYTGVGGNALLVLSSDVPEMIAPLIGAPVGITISWVAVSGEQLCRWLRNG
jgi:hypothetical protein